MRGRSVKAQEDEPESVHVRDFSFCVLAFDFNVLNIISTTLSLAVSLISPLSQTYPCKDTYAKERTRIQGSWIPDLSLAIDDTRSVSYNCDIGNIDTPYKRIVARSNVVSSLAVRRQRSHQFVQGDIVGST